MKKDGTCFPDAAQFVSDNAGWTLVHGIVSGQGDLEGIRYTHAWVEKDGMAYDVPLGIGMNLDLYYGLGKINPEECVRYSRAQMVEKLLEHEHWGPWDIKETEDEQRIKRNS
jgi:hypothetical protein